MTDVEGFLFFFGQGFFLQASLILVLGAQNLFVLEAGMRKNWPLTVAFVCALCDSLLILIAIFFSNSRFFQHPLFHWGIGGSGILFLSGYSFLKMKDFCVLSTQMRSSASLSDVDPSHTLTLSVTDPKEASWSFSSSLWKALGFSLLNPHSYLDAFVLIGGLSTHYPRIPERLLFGSGAATFSWIWFFGLVFLSKKAGPLLSLPHRRRWISFLTSLFLAYLSFELAKQLYQNF